MYVYIYVCVNEGVCVCVRVTCVQLCDESICVCLHASVFVFVNKCCIWKSESVIITRLSVCVCVRARKR